MGRVFPQALLDSFERSPGTPAFEHGSRVVTRRQVLELIGRFTTALRAADLRAGSGVAVATAVTPEGFAARIAAHVLGCRVIGVPPGLPAAQLRHVAGRGVDALVVDQASESAALFAAAGRARVLRLERDLHADYRKPVAAGRAEDLAMVTFTSGSTGMPKGVAVSYAALSAHWAWQPSRWSTQTILLTTGYARFLLSGSLDSTVTQEHLALCLLSGGTAVIPESTPAFPAALHELRITASLLSVPRLYRLLDLLREQQPQQAAQAQFSGLHVLLVHGSPLPPHRLAEAFERIGPAVHQGYGQTETGLLTLLSAEDVRAWPEALSSVGRPCPEVDLEVRDERGAPVPPGTAGEIWVRTPCQLTGYWREEAQTAEIVRGSWVRTLDLGHLDSRGFVHLTGRARDVVIVNAVPHYLGPIERALTAHPDVDQAYVIGAPDEHTGEAAHAFVVGRPGRRPDQADLRAQVARELGAAAVPATITLLPEVPVAAGGKPDRDALLASITS